MSLEISFMCVQLLCSKPVVSEMSGKGRQNDGRKVYRTALFFIWCKTSKTFSFQYVVLNLEGGMNFAKRIFKQMDTKPNIKTLQN